MKTQYEAIELLRSRGIKEMPLLKNEISNGLYFIHEYKNGIKVSVRLIKLVEIDTDDGSHVFQYDNEKGNDRLIWGNPNTEVFVSVTKPSKWEECISIISKH